MTKRNWIIILSIVILLTLFGLVVLGIIFLPRLFNNSSDSNVTNYCEMSNCHGLNVTCGKNPPLMCTMEYQIGDNCRQFASCQLSGSTCVLNQSLEFIKCKTCVENCISRNNGPEQIADQFTCADNCLEGGSLK
jgi:hypothetical protein